MPWIDAFEPAIKRQRDVVLTATWGHLAPKPKRKFTGYILFTLGEYGDYVVIRSKFKGLVDSPWLCEHLHDFIAEHAKQEGEVYLFAGTYEMLKEDASQHRFIGEVRQLKIPNPQNR